MLWPAASAGFAAQGHRAIVVDTTRQPEPGRDNLIDYFPKAEIEKLSDEDVMRVVTQYDPKSQLVVVLLKTRERRVRIVSSRGPVVVLAC